MLTCCQKKHYLVFKALVNLELDTIRNNFPTGVEGVDKEDSHWCQISTDAYGEGEVSVPGCGNRQFTDHMEWL